MSQATRPALGRYPGTTNREGTCLSWRTQVQGWHGRGAYQRNRQADSAPPARSARAHHASGPVRPGRRGVLAPACSVPIGSCPSSLRLIPTTCKPGTIPSFWHVYEGVCHGLSSLFLPACTDCPSLAVPRVPVGVVT